MNEFAVGSLCRSVSLRVTVALLAACPPSALAAQAWVQGYPSAERVVADMRGTDPIDTAARQQAALFALIRALHDRSGRNMPPAALAKEQEYGNARAAIWNRLKQTVDTACKGANCDVRRYTRLINIDYGYTTPFGAQILRTYLSGDALSELATARRPVPRPAVARKPTGEGSQVFSGSSESRDGLLIKAMVGALVVVAILVFLIKALAGQSLATVTGVVSHARESLDVSGGDNGPVRTDKSGRFRVDNRPVFMNGTLTVESGDVVTVVGFEDHGAFHALALRNESTSYVYWEHHSRVMAWSRIIVGMVGLLIVVGVFLLFAGLVGLWNGTRVRRAIALLRSTPPVRAVASA